MQPRRVVHASFWAVAGQAVNALSLLVPIPFLVHYLGADHYGVWAIANVVIGYLAFTDFGMTAAARRFGSTARDDGEEARVVWSAAAIAGAITVAAAALVALFARQIMQWLVHRPDGVLALQLLALAYVLRGATAIVTAPQIVRLRNDLNTAILTIFAVAQVGAIVIVLRRGRGLGSVAAVVAIISAAAFVAHLTASAKLLPPLRRPRLDGLGRLAAFGAPLALSYVASAILTQSEKVILARFTTAAVVGHYAVAFTIASGFAIPALALAQTLVPSFARLQGETERLRFAYDTTLRWTILVAIPATALLAVVARPLFRIGFGEELAAASTAPFLILIAGAAINLIGNIPYILLQAVGRTGFIAKCHLIEIPLYLALAIPLTARYGALGAASAWALRVTVDALVLAWGASRSAPRLRPGR